jgi:hypothetical protein
VLEQQAQVRERLAVAPEHEAAGGLAIEPMRQLGPARQAEAQRAEPVLQARSAFRPAMHRQAGRLVDHQHQAVAMEHARENLVLGRVLRIEDLVQDFRVQHFRLHHETAITAAPMKHLSVRHCRA